MTTQLHASRVLTGIIRRAEEAGLPRLSWSVYPYDGAALDAQPWGGDDEARTIVMAAWGDHLGVKAKTQRYDDYTEIKIAAEVHGVPVRIFTHVDKAANYGQRGGAK